MSQRARGALVIAAMAVTLLATSCEAVVYSKADAARTDAGLAALGRSPVLTAAARAKSAAMCAAGATAPTPSPTAAYNRETIAAAKEMVGSARLDPTIADAGNRNVAATNKIVAGWPTNAFVDPRWDDIGVGEVTCGDGRLYLTAVVTDGPSMAAKGRYSTTIYPMDQVVETTDIVYGTAPDHDVPIGVPPTGEIVDLKLDLFEPPAADATTNRPVIVLVHGGGYAHGDKSVQAQNARSYARRGFVAISIDYRLRTLSGESDPRYLDAATDAVDDAMEAVRWVKANATGLRVDPSRIAMIGVSAGGGIALGVATQNDPTPGGPLAAHSPDIAAAIASGATFIRAIDAGLATFGPTGRPVKMLHYEIDSATGATAADALTTCEAIWAGGATCDHLITPGTGHGHTLRAGGPWWTSEFGPYLWQHLRLG